jgi:hypothetical protein
MLEVLEPTPGKPHAPLGALPYYPIVNFLTDRPMATRFTTLLPLKKYPDRDQQALEALDADPDTSVVYGLQHLTSMPRPQAYAPELFEGLIRRYRLGEVFDEEPDGIVFALLERREQEGPDAHEVVLYDFADALEHSRFSAPDYDPIAAKGGVVDATLESWPFERPVVSFPATPSPGRSRLSYALRDVGPVRLRFGVAMNPDEWRHFFPTNLRFVVRLDEETLFDRTLDPRQDLDDRRWIWADLPLEDYSGRTLHFEISTSNGYGAGLHLGGFARPRLVREEAEPMHAPAETRDAQ